MTGLAGHCQCFGESGLQATTHAGANGERCCDLCGWPVASAIPPAQDGDPVRLTVQADEMAKAADAITRLRRYAGHMPSCGSITVPWEEVGPCDCGLTALIADIGEG